MMTVTNQHPRLGATRAVRGLIVESAYATLGLGGAAVELVRSLDRLRMEVPGQVRQLVDQGVATGRSLPDLAGREFQGLARRGRDLVGAIHTSNATREAVHRTRTARSRVKAAGGTSIGRAAEGAVEAAEQAATIVAVGTTSTEERQGRIQPPKARRPATTRRPKPAATRSASTKPRRTKPMRPTRAPADGQTPTGPYEERTVEELQARAAELEIEGRSSMTKDELIRALRGKR
jgi:hypothetical protein